MTTFVLWINHEEIRVYRLSVGGVHRQTFLMSGHHHPKESLGRNHTLQESDVTRFYHQVAASLENEDAGDWLLMGPGLGRLHFYRHLEKHHRNLVDRVVGCEQTGAMDDGEILRESASFFHRLRLFQDLQ